MSDFFANGKITVPGLGSQFWRIDDTESPDEGVTFLQQPPILFNASKYSAQQVAEFLKLLNNPPGSTTDATPPKRA